MQTLAEPVPPSPWDTVDPARDVTVVPAPLPVAEAPEPGPEVTREADVDGGGAGAPASPPGGTFTIPLICLGVGLIALCLLIPAADEVRRLAYERDRLKADLEQLQKQVDTNSAFLQRVADDPTLAERLARRQMKMVPEGTQVLELKSQPKAGAAADLSPFLLVTIPPPAPMPPYRPVGGFLASACRHPKTQLYLIGAALMMIACGLVMSKSDRPCAEEAPGEGSSVDD
ncbi:MAG TPA: hypothetical protein VER17_01610 [Tepidisphaeraceae bacterium]|nr:hypothetical protein [Tepidisphaeraceae bacterium]